MWRAGLERAAGKAGCVGRQQSTSALVVLIRASVAPLAHLYLPLSLYLLSPLLQFGAEIGVGMCESVAHGTNWQLFAKTFTAWCFTVFISGAFSAFFFAAGRQGQIPYKLPFSLPTHPRPGCVYYAH